MLEPSASRFWQAALQSGLVDPKALQACWDSIAPEKRVAEHIDRRLARLAVQNGVVSLWQAQQLISGRSTGFKIDRYVLLDMIGQGGMGRVYLARDSRLNRRVAVKILSPERLNNPRAHARFEREGLVGAQLQHENLVRIYDVGDSGGRCYLVMEYIEGKNIGQLIADGPLPPTTAAKLVRQVALGLEHGHKKGLIHRDVNPYNILVTRDGTAKLTDLGLALDLADSDHVTRDGATVGTFDYVSPEQARHSHSVDARSDIYSLGCTLYHMLTGQVPFPTGSLPQKLFGHQEVEPEPVENFAPGVPEGLGAVVRQMMRKSPGDRYPTCHEVAEALEPYIGEPVGTTTSSADSAIVHEQHSLEASAVTMESPPVRSVSAVARPASSPGTPVTSETETVAAGPSNGQGHGVHLGLDLGPESPLTGTRFSAGARSKPPAPAPSSSVVTPAPVPSPVVAPEAAPIVKKTDATAAGSPLGLNLALDFGPEAPLSGSSTGSRSKAKAKPMAATTAAKPTPKVAASLLADLTNKPWFLPAAIAAGVALLLGLGMLAYRGGDTGASTADVGVKGKKAAKPKASSDKGRAALSPSTTKTKKTLPTPSGQQVMVIVPGDDGAVIEPTLGDAMKVAIGRRGYVLLVNASPLTIPKSQTITVSGGPLRIVAGPGVRPVVQVEIADGKPFLSTSTGTPIQIEGVTFEVKYASSGPDPTPVIAAGSDVRLDHCAFRLDGAVEGARALEAKGETFSADGCWFENFDRAIDVDSFNGSKATLRQCMIVHTRPDAPSGAAPLGWAVRLRGMPGGPGTSGRLLKMDHCTVKGNGFLDLAGFSKESPVRVDLTSCVVLAETLVAWAPDAPQGVTPPPAATPPDRETLSWSGTGNEYDIRGKSWVMLAPAPGTPLVALPDAPTTLESWTQRLGSETSPVSPPVRFATEPSALPATPSPTDFALQDQRSDSPGAAPEFVGPGAKAIPSSR
jgi:eukaryotic-like serine/threonine-protein kinase